MKVLFIGDIVGNVGRQMIEDYLYRIRKDYQIDWRAMNLCLKRSGMLPQSLCF